MQIKHFPLPLSRNAKPCDHPASSAVSHKFYLLRLVLDWFPYKNKPSPPPPPSLSKNTKGCDHPANSLTGVAAKPNQTLHLYRHFLHQFLVKIKEKTCVPNQFAFSKLISVFQMNLCFPNKLVLAKQICVFQICLFVCEGEVCLNCVLS